MDVVVLYTIFFVQGSTLDLHIDFWSFEYTLMDIVVLYSIFFVHASHYAFVGFGN